METNIRNDRLDEPTYQTSGIGIDALIRVPLYIIVGFVVVVWEAINRVVRSVQQSTHFASGAGAKPAGTVTPTPVKVPMMPIDNYSQLDADDIVARLDTLGPGDLAIVRRYETDHDKRQAVLDAIDQRLTRTH